MHAMRLPPIPKWNTQTADFDSHDFAQQARECERSLLPTDIIFPRAGQIWEALRDCEVYFVAGNSKTPGTGGRARLKQGERVRILSLDDPRPVQVSFQPVRYDALRESIVPHDVRSTAGYLQYTLYLRTAYTPGCPRQEAGYFHELFRRVDDAA
jgi:hypothetical protein